MKKQVEEWYKMYLDLSKLDESKMSPVQATETKRAFYAGVGCLIKKFSNGDLGDMDPTEAMDYFTGIHDEVGAFYGEEIEKFNVNGAK